MNSMIGILLLEHLHSIGSTSYQWKGILKGRVYVPTCIPNLPYMVCYGFPKVSLLPPPINSNIKKPIHKHHTLGACQNPETVGKSSVHVYKRIL